MTDTRLILASKSQSRIMLLQNAGLDFDIVPADIDERAVEAPLVEADFGPDDIAEVLAEAKAREVSERRPGALVIGSDQTLGLGEKRFNKPETIEDARRQLLAMRGATHSLNSAIACVKDGETLWRHISRADLTMRDFTPEFAGHYLALVGSEALTSVGAYRLEGPGIQLFETIEGDYFTILGLPLLPLLGFLRDRGILET
ncbi:MAG TPA: Maf-like protein [Kaistiaceae bacterium]|nr:Maf-like protein [Kaistiaceae bacterium]